jgi:hypothetical protein
MKEKIRQIIWENKPSQKKAAEEITTHIFEFMEWVIFGEGNEYYSDNEDHCFYRFEYLEDGTEHLVDPMTLNELYQHWLKEVKK